MERRSPQMNAAVMAHEELLPSEHEKVFMVQRSTVKGAVREGSGRAEVPRGGPGSGGGCRPASSDGHPVLGRKTVQGSRGKVQGLRLGAGDGWDRGFEDITGWILIFCGSVEHIVLHY